MWVQIILHVDLIHYLIHRQVTVGMVSNFVFVRYKDEYKVVCNKVSDYLFKRIFRWTRYVREQVGNYDPIDKEPSLLVAFSFVTFFNGLAKQIWIDQWHSIFGNVLNRD